MRQKNLIVLDRDGVINEDSDDYIKSVDEWKAIPGSIEAIVKLKRAGFTVAVATNQSGIGRGFYNVETLAAMHSKFQRLLSAYGVCVDAIFFCPHLPEDQCQCRKPLPGLLHRISAHFEKPLGDVWVVGDSLRDLEAADEVNSKAILVRTGKGKASHEKLPKVSETPVFENLADAVDAILQQQS